MCRWVLAVGTINFFERKPERQYRSCDVQSALQVATTVQACLLACWFDDTQDGDGLRRASLGTFGCVAKNRIKLWDLLDFNSGPRQIVCTLVLHLIFGGS